MKLDRLVDFRSMAPVIGRRLASGVRANSIPSLDGVKSREESRADRLLPHQPLTCIALHHMKLLERLSRKGTSA